MIYSNGRKWLSNYIYRQFLLIKDYYKDGDKKKRRDRYSLQAEDRSVSSSGGGTISFQSAPLRNKVAKVSI